MQERVENKIVVPESRMSACKVCGGEVSKPGPGCD